jgi:hypothetical protein
MGCGEQWFLGSRLASGKRFNFPGKRSTLSDGSFASMAAT